MAVSIRPAQMASPRTLLAENCWDAVWTRLMPPAFDAEYAAPPAPERRPATLAVQMIDPPPRLAIAGAAYLIARKGPIRLTRRISAQSASVCSAIEAKPPEIPALAKKMSSW